LLHTSLVADSANSKDEAVQQNEASVFRIRQGSGCWSIYEDQLAEPVASFPDKGEALNYAMCLARRRVNWQVLTGGHAGTAASGSGASRA
jgi:hypothetical protein